MAATMQTDFVQVHSGGGGSGGEIATAARRYGGSSAGEGEEEDGANEAGREMQVSADPEYRRFRFGRYCRTHFLVKGFPVNSFCSRSCQ